MALFDQFLGSLLPEDGTVDQVLTEHASTRSIMRLAQALLFRNKGRDAEDAAVIIRWSLKHQYRDKNEGTYGMWKTSAVGDRRDQNWREFVGCDLIIIYEKYRHVLEDTLLAEIRTSLIAAARGAMERDVRAEYTNISIMSAFLMDYVGTTFSLDDLRRGGLKKARDVYALFQRHGTFSEYNSPTYYGVTLVALALWREMASEEIKGMGISLEESLWEEIAEVYNPHLRNMAGPYFRGYGMDMTKYYAIAGIWIAVALDSEALAPLPKGPAAKDNEMSNIAPIYHLGLAVPKHVLSGLKSFESRPFVDKLVPNKYPGDTLKRVTSAIYSDWMMGGLWGSRRSWNQIKPGTIHWVNSDSETEWLLVPGDGNTDVLVTPGSMAVYHAGKPFTDLSIYVYARDISEDNFLKDKWIFGGMELAIDSELPRSMYKIVDHSMLYSECAISEGYPAVMKVTFRVPSGWAPADPLLVISPVKQARDDGKL
jgi:hypothetical protein